MVSDKNPIDEVVTSSISANSKRHRIMPGASVDSIPPSNLREGLICSDLCSLKPARSTLEVKRGGDNYRGEHQS